MRLAHHWAAIERRRGQRRARKPPVARDRRALRSRERNERRATRRVTASAAAHASGHASSRRPLPLQPRDQRRRCRHAFCRERAFRVRWQSCRAASRWRRARPRGSRSSVSSDRLQRHRPQAPLRPRLFSPPYANARSAYTTPAGDVGVPLVERNRGQRERCIPSVARRTSTPGRSPAPATWSRRCDRAVLISRWLAGLDLHWRGYQDGRPHHRRAR